MSFTNSTTEIISTTEISSIEENPEQKTTKKWKLYPKRFGIIGIFMCFTFSVSFQWGQYAIVANATKKYYGVSETLVDWTIMVYMLVPLPFVIPALFCLDKHGIRKCIIVSSLGVCAGAWIKLYASLERDRFAMVIAGQAVEAFFQVLVFGFAARVSAIWFGASELSMACACAFFGDQFGSVLGCLIPALLVQESDDCREIRRGLIRLNLGISVFTTFVSVLIILFFSAAPPTPPSAAAAKQKKADSMVEMLGILKKLMKKRSFIIMSASYGMLNAVCSCIVALFNQMFKQYYPHADDIHTGILGALLTITGVIGALIGGYILDRKRCFKTVAIIVYVGSVLCMFVYSFILEIGNLTLFYCMMGVMGFFIFGYYSLGIQMAIEISYPVSECISTSMLLYSSQIFGLLFTSPYRYLYTIMGDFVANMAVTFILLIGAVMTCFIPPKCERQNAQAEVAEDDASPPKGGIFVVDGDVFYSKCAPSPIPVQGRDERDGPGGPGGRGGRGGGTLGSN